jgi:hypothetical protein
MGCDLIHQSWKTVCGGAIETIRDEVIPAFEKGGLAGKGDAAR